MLIRRRQGLYAERCRRLV